MWQLVTKLIFRKIGQLSVSPPQPAHFAPSEKLTYFVWKTFRWNAEQWVLIRIGEKFYINRTDVLGLPSLSLTACPMYDLEEE